MLGDGWIAGVWVFACCEARNLARFSCSFWIKASASLKDLFRLCSSCWPAIFTADANVKIALADLCLQKIKRGYYLLIVTTNLKSHPYPHNIPITSIKKIIMIMRQPDINNETLHLTKSIACRGRIFELLYLFLMISSMYMISVSPSIKVQK